MRRLVYAAVIGSLLLATSAPTTESLAATSSTSGIAETTGGVANTWTNYTNAGGTEGQSIAANDTVQVACRVAGFQVADGNTWWYQIASSPWNRTYYASADAFYNNGKTSGGLIGTPLYDASVAICPASTDYSETTGGNASTWSNPATAGGIQGPSISTHTTLQVVCRIAGFKVADGNTWWYEIASSPWNSTYYASADAFYNDGATSGSLVGTPFYDPAVPRCPVLSGYHETTEGVTNTWGDYLDAAGTHGLSISASATVQVQCRVTGFAVADGNNWWYLISSSPWDNQFYASADAFYNNGSTSGSLVGTPFVDPSVPTCASSSSGPLGLTEVAGGAAKTWTNFTTAGGARGPSVIARRAVTVVCRTKGLRVSDGDTWWYRIGSSPWNSAYYASADAFYNNGATSGSLTGTPLYDPTIPVCGTTSTVHVETTGGMAHTWTNYSTAGGIAGPTIPAFYSLGIACRLKGFKVADGNIWWYRIQSPAWSNAYYVSADAFYNNGHASGSLHETPFYDSAVPKCGKPSLTTTALSLPGSTRNEN